MFIEKPEGIVAEYLSKIGFAEPPTNISIDDGDLGAALTQAASQHGEHESSEQVLARAIARLAWAKYGVPDEQTTPSKLSTGESANLRHMQQFNELLRQEVTQNTPAVLVGLDVLAGEIKDASESAYAQSITNREALLADSEITRTQLTQAVQDATKSGEANSQRVIETLTTGSTAVESAIKQHNDDTVVALGSIRKAICIVGGILALLLVLLILVPRAHAQGSQIYVIKTQNAGTPLKAHAAPFTINCGSGTSCSDSGTLFTITAAGGPGGGGYATIQQAASSLAQRVTVNFFGGITCADNAGAGRTDCSLTTNAAVANQYVTGVDSSGNLTRKQVAYAEVSGTPTLATVATSGAYADLSGKPTLAATKAAVSGQPLLSYDSSTGLFTQGALTAANVGALSSSTVLAATKTAVAGSPLLSYDSTTGAFTQGALTAAQVGALPSGTVIAATKTAVAGSPLLSYDSTTGAFTQGALTAANVGALASSTVLPVTDAGAANNFLTSYTSGTGAFTHARPTCSSLSDAGTLCTSSATSFAPTAHNLLSASHGDTTAASAVRGDMIGAVGVTPTWQRIAHGATSGSYWKWNGADIVASSLAASGTGSPTACTNQVVTGFTLNADAAPTSSCTSLTTSFLPTIPLSQLATQAADTALMNATAGVAAPTAVAIGNCGDSTHALSYNTTTHAWGCQAITAAAAAAGLDKQVQFNDGGSAIGADAGLTYDKATDVLTVGVASATAAVTVGGTGSGAVQLTGSTSGTMTQTVPATVTDYTLTWPAAGCTGYLLDTAGTVSCDTTVANTGVDINASDQVTATHLASPLPSAQGGTANGFFTVSGPASSAKTFTFPNANATIPQVVASGTSTLTTTSVASGACQTTVTTAATNVATTDAIAWSYASFAAPSTDGRLILNGWPTSGNVNWSRCNPTSASITPSALVINWRVIR